MLAYSNQQPGLIGEEVTDFLLVHGAGQGAWSWGQVWGYLTAPEEHPPRLNAPKRANKVYPMDLPGHGADADGDTGEVRLEECIHSITRAVEREGLKDLVLVGHGFAGGLVDEVVFFDHALSNPALAQLRDARKKRNSAQDAIPQLMVMEDKPQPRPTGVGNFLDCQPSVHDLNGHRCNG